MSNQLIDMLASIRSPKNHFIERLDMIAGYNEDEIAQIEQLYNISIHGQLKELLMTMGKCSGGLLLAGNICMYRDYKNNISRLGKEMQQIWNDESSIYFKKAMNNICLVDKKMFIFSTDNEGILTYFMLTVDDNDYIYEYDENNDDFNDHDKDVTIEYHPVRLIGTLYDYLKLYRKRIGAWSANGTYRGDEHPDLFADLTTGRLL
ncbi:MULTISPECIES: SMI1/KNR4 family protein [unclassified Acinetobacter]|uniref:SMI1/KNR4 family protein n=1 Tax=unclassified Acinetobacter TaxID=196816 RepID=UPI0035B977BE